MPYVPVRAMGSDTVVSERIPAAAEVKASDHTKLDGVTDNTKDLQALLDSYHGKPLHLLIDGKGLGTLRLHSNTQITIPKGASWTVPEGSNLAAFETYEKSRTQFTTKNIILDGAGTIECNGSSMARYQSSKGISPKKVVEGFYSAANGEFVVGLRLFNIKQLVIRDLTILHAATFAIHLFKDSNILIENIFCDEGPQPYLGTDMIHCNGYVQQAVFRNLTCRVYDDVIALNADDGADPGLIEDVNILGPYVTSGPITDISVHDVYCLPGSMQTFRMLSKYSLVDRILLKNFSGSVTNYIGNISGYIDNVPGHFGTIRLENFDLKIEARQSMGDTNPVLLSIRDSIQSLTITDLRITPIDDRTLFSLTASVKMGVLNFKNISVFSVIPAADSAKVIQFDGSIQLARLSSVSWTTLPGTSNDFITGTGQIKDLRLDHIKMPSMNQFVRGVRIGKTATGL